MTFRRWLVIIATIDLALLGVGIFGSAAFENRAWLNFGISAMAVITFFGLLLASDEPGREAGMRRAIAASITVTYLSVVTVFLFYRMSGPIPPITAAFLTSFTSIVGIVLAFYFGASALIDSRAGGSST